MTNDSIYNRLRELSWRRRLTGPEEAELRAWLSDHPEQQSDWETEAGLSASLSRLPEVPVPCNFTARVLQAVERESAEELRRGDGKWLTWLRRRWLPRVAFVAVVVGAGLLSYQQVGVAHRRKLAESVAVVSGVSSLPSPDILKDFDAIQALKPTPHSDEQLLSLLQ